MKTKDMPAVKEAAKIAALIMKRYHEMMQKAKNDSKR